METKDRKVEETHVLWNGAWFKNKAGETDEEARQRLSDALDKMPSRDLS